MKYIYLNLIALIGFVATYFALNYGYFLNINNIVSNYPRSNSLVLPFFFITDVGGLMFIFVASLYLVTYLVIKGNNRGALYTTLALLGGLASQTIIKNVLEMSRPLNGLISTSGYSFPSGHANMTTILFLCFCFYVVRRMVHKNKRILYFTLSFLIIILVGVSRIYLNAHWVSDVVAGWCLGMFWATLPLLWQNFVIFKHKFLNNV